MRSFAFPLIAALLFGAVSFAPSAAASEGPCDWADVLRTICDKVREEVAPLINDPDIGWVEESVRHLCDHWLDGCKLGVAPVLP